MTDIFRIFASITDDSHLCTTMADGPVEALELVRVNDWARMQLTCTAYAERVTEVREDA